MNLSKISIKKQLLHALWFPVSILGFLFLCGFSSINASAQKPFYIQAQERIDYLVEVKNIDVSLESIAYETGLTEYEVESVIFGKSIIIDNELLDLFCDAILCSFEVNENSEITLIAKEGKRVEVYSKMTGEIIYYTNND